MKGLA